MGPRVSFQSFWSGFDPSAFFLPLVESAVGEAPVRVECGAACDLEFASVFSHTDRNMALLHRAGRRVRRLWTDDVPGLRPFAKPSPRARASVWYTGENHRPPADGWDRTWSFEPDSVLARNSYLPFWLKLLPELLAPVHVARSAENRLGRELTVDELLSPRASQVSERPRFACLFTTHAIPARMQLVKALSSIGEVDVYGRASGRVVDSKLETASQYRFMLCPENDLYPGYVTEKAFDAWGAGCLPTWSGLDAHGDLNPAALLNLAAEPSLDALVERVARLEADPARMDEMGGQPLLARRPSLDRLRDDVRALLGATTG